MTYLGHGYMACIPFVASLMENLVPRLKSGSKTLWMEDASKKQTLEDECPTSGSVQGMIDGEVRVKHNPRRRHPTLLEL
jgi:hypothetical protein